MPASTPLSLRLPAPLAEELTRMARLAGRTPSSMAVRLLDEALRMRAAPGIHFVDRPGGRSAAVMGTGLQVWQMCDLIQSYEGDYARLLKDFPHYYQYQLDAAMHYRDQYPDEIKAAQENNRILAERIESGNYPGVRVIDVYTGEDAESAA